MEFDYDYYKLKCTKCGRKILVEAIRFGVSHVASIMVTCADCLTEDNIPPEFKKTHPLEYEDVMKWVKEK